MVKIQVALLVLAILLLNMSEHGSCLGKDHVQASGSP